MSETMNEALGGTLPPPDIDTDRLYVIHGATLFARMDTHCALLDHAKTWATLVPVETVKLSQGGELDAREICSYVGILHELLIGTVAEHVEHYRKQLTACWKRFTAEPVDGEEQPDVPGFGEPSLRKQNEVLARNGIDKFTQTMTGGVHDLDAAMARCYPGREFRQDAYTRNLLARLVAQYRDRLLSKGEAARGLFVEDSSSLDRLIEALEIYKEDGEIIVG